MATKFKSPSYACLHVPNFYLQSIVRTHPEYKSKAVAILDGQPPAEFVTSINHLAAAKGLHRGVSRIEADLLNDIFFIHRSVDAEEATRFELLHLAYNITPRIEDRSQADDYTLILDISASIGLFDNLETLAASILNTISRIDMAASIAISRNIYTSECIARYQQSLPRSVIIPPGQERKLLSNLPITYLPLTNDQTITLSAWGIRSFQELASLSTTELVTRFGQNGKKLSDICRGEHEHLLIPLDFTPLIKETRAYDEPVSSIESLLFSLSSMLGFILKHVADQCSAIAYIDIIFKLHSGNQYTRTIRPSRPTNDKRLLLRLLHLHLIEHPPQSGVICSQLIAQPGRSSKIQQGLFSPQTPEIQNLDVLMARIHSIVGKDNAGSPLITNSHAPDSFALASFRIKENFRNTSHAEGTTSAIRRAYPQPVLSVAVSNSRPHHFSIKQHNYSVLSAFGPWTNSGGWFDHGFWNLDSWDIVAHQCPDNDVAYYCLSQNKKWNEWQLDGIYD